MKIMESYFMFLHIFFTFFLCIESRVISNVFIFVDLWQVGRFVGFFFLVLKYLCCNKMSLRISGITLLSPIANGHGLYVFPFADESITIQWSPKNIFAFRVWVIMGTEIWLYSTAPPTLPNKRVSRNWVNQKS